MSVKQFIRELNGKRIEGELIGTSLYSLITSFVLLGLLYYFKFRFIEDFLPRYGLFLFLSALTIALAVPTVRQIRAYRSMPCMSGMMVGMTMGMMVGFLGGYFIGATNGMFVGGVFGMLTGIVFGVWMGSCCGVMGYMEGIMAGFMGGWMGAMTSVMLLNDHLRLATIFIFAVGAVILVSLNYLIYLETRESERHRIEDPFVAVSISFVLTTVIAWIMVYGPRSALS